MGEHLQCDDECNQLCFLIREGKNWGIQATLLWACCHPSSSPHHHFAALSPFLLKPLPSTVPPPASLQSTAPSLALQNRIRCIVSPKLSSTPLVTRRQEHRIVKLRLRLHGVQNTVGLLEGKALRHKAASGDDGELWMWTRGALCRLRGGRRKLCYGGGIGSNCM
ncbi:uncharacterized protein LOC110266287 [Arachis ipaensis]|uniref:uncharacterized protein LOC110266287 n=1 Tax=Arachis ipaensis TaxID=130454 RepID=UPI000A2B50F8|nr:uncharacterized protein LOC110266287 [Arachis ipaensis]